MASSIGDDGLVRRFGFLVKDDYMCSDHDGFGLLMNQQF
jgi:hypothetical protein